MFCVVTGGSGSGKSRFAEDLIVRLYKKNDTKSVSESPGSLYYFATMVPCGRETKEKIARHRQLRAGKGFVTVECQTGLGTHVPREELSLIHIFGKEKKQNTLCGNLSLWYLACGSACDTGNLSLHVYGNPWGDTESGEFSFPPLWDR